MIPSISLKNQVILPGFELVKEEDMRLHFVRWITR